MEGAVFIAIAASIGNLLQGWDNSAIAGSVLYIKREFKLESEPTLEGLIVAMSLIGATFITTFSGAMSDYVGRRPMLIASSVLYFVSGLMMLWSPNVYTLLLARLMDGLGVGLAVTLIPVYISETAPSDIRGMLNTLPQFSGSCGMFVSYCMVFGMSLMTEPSWRVMLSVLSVPSLIFFLLTLLYLPESPRWLVSKGKMLEAKRVLQKLRGREDVSGEMALLVEGLEVGGETSIEKYIIGPAEEIIDGQETAAGNNKIILYGPEEGLTLVARPATGQSALVLVSRQGSRESQRSIPFMDPLVTLFGSVHENPPETGSMLGSAFPNFGSMFSVAGQPKNDRWDEESLHREGEYEGHASDAEESRSESDLHSPLISRQTTSMEEGGMAQAGTSNGSILNAGHCSRLAQRHVGESLGTTGIGGGWHLAWKWTERDGSSGEREGGLKKVYLHQEGTTGSMRGSFFSQRDGDTPAEAQFIPAAALVSDSALHSKDLLEAHPVGPAMIHPAEVAVKGPHWSELLEPGVKHALCVGISIQILQQLAGINGVLYYTPQILEQAGVGALLTKLGLNSDSSSFLTSAFTTLLMLPCIAIAMRLMDISGRRSLLLSTIPVLIVALIILVISNVVSMNIIVHAVLSTASVIIYFCCFVVAFGPVPNILCSEIFPTRVRGVCIALCSLTFWIGDILVTYTLPILLKYIGLAGVFGIYAFVCIISWVFVFLKVPETKGMPLEVIAEFFSIGSKQMEGN